MKKFVLLFLVLCVSLSLFGCNGMKSELIDYDEMVGGGGYYVEDAGGMIKIDGKPYGMIDAGVAGSFEGGGGNSHYERPAGLLTASAWDDNLHYSEWLDLFFVGQSEEENGKFANKYQKSGWGFNSLDRVTVKVVDKETQASVSGATVISYNNFGAVTFTARTNANGVAYLFPGTESGNIKVVSGEGAAETAFSSEERELALDISGSKDKENIIKLMFVVDVTGSMGDELSYLNNELIDIVKRVAASDKQTRIDLSLLFYRDHTDEVLFDYYDFLNVTDEQNLQLQLKNISKQRADGGGDYPEAVDEALAFALNREWGEENSTRLIFHILDAPSHESDENKARYLNAVSLAAEKGVRICPVLCSSADELCEFLVRQEAVYTGGTFIYLTNDSGYGNSHYDPEMPETTVEALNDLVVRLINGYHSGIFAEPVPWIKAEQQ